MKKTRFEHHIRIQHKHVLGLRGRDQLVVCRTKPDISIRKMDESNGTPVAFNDRGCFVCGGVIPDRDTEILECLLLQAFDAGFQVLRAQPAHR